MKRSLLVVLVSSLVSTAALADEPASSGDSPRSTAPRNSITVQSGIGFIFSSFGVGGTMPVSLQYERALGDHISVYVAPQILVPMPFFGIGGELGARYFFFGDAVHGFSVGAGVSGDYIGAVAGGSFLITPKAGVTYTGIWDSGFTMSVGLGIGYTVAAGAGAGLALGLTVPFTFGLGYSF